MRMEEIENAVNRVEQRHAHAGIRTRLMRPGELLPWSTEEIGWCVQQLRPETVFVAEQYGQPIGLIVAAEVHGTLLLMRMLGSGGVWVRPLWRFIRHVCFQRKIAGVWMVAENQNEAERKLLKLLPRDFDEARSEERSTILFAGRWNYAGTFSSPVAGAAVDGGERRGRPGNDSLRTDAGERIEQQQPDDATAGQHAGGGDQGSAAGGGDRAAGEHPGEYRRQLDADIVFNDEREERGGSIRSQLDHAIFGRQWIEQRADLGRNDNAEQRAAGRPEQSATA
jgi:hypothetical protein